MLQEIENEFTFAFVFPGRHFQSCFFFAVVFCFLPCARGIHEMTTMRKNNQRLVSGTKLKMAIREKNLEILFGNPIQHAFESCHSSMLS